jgi:hypothetical protein
VPKCFREFKKTSSFKGHIACNLIADSGVFSELLRKENVLVRILNILSKSSTLLKDDCFDGVLTVNVRN